MDLLNCKIKPIYLKYLAAASGSAVILISVKASLPTASVKSDSSKDTLFVPTPVLMTVTSSCKTEIAGDNTAASAVTAKHKVQKIKSPKNPIFFILNGFLSEFLDVDILPTVKFFYAKS